MGVFAVLGVLLLFLAFRIRSGRLALIAVYIFGIGVWGDGGGIGVFGAIGAAVLGAGAFTSDARIVGLGVATFFFGAYFSTMA